ncbi:sensor histidine kinase [Clostridium grantii]|uniref:histidine kinase n=1 Tax=Clostridium grantii DSM 8605 TaxID=1121316 RepID=A0A1M5WU25_9CLOT|nr:sensor histidine kinase [Clostridium grantii]SHH91106.1 two-component system, sensor histidine kinase YesM [Clostridium grantii DSM 8605]
MNEIIKKIIDLFDIRKQFNTIQMQILIYFASLIIGIIILLDAIFYLLSYDVIINEAEEYSAQIVTQIGRNIEYYANYMNDISYIINSDTKIKELLSEDKNLGEESYVKKESSVLNSIMKARNDIVSIYVFCENGIIISNDTNYELKKNIEYTTLDWYKKAILAKEKSVFSYSHVQNFIEDKYNWVVSLSNKITDSTNEKILGVTVIDINYKVFSDLCKEVELGKRGYVYIVDKYGEIIYHPKQQLIYSNIKTEDISRVLKSNDGSYSESIDKEKRLITVKTIPTVEWKVVGVTYMADILIGKEKLIHLIFAITIICLIIATLVSIKISKKISKPIKELETAMKEVENGAIDIEIQILGHDEVAHLGEAFSNMIKRIKYLLIQVEEDQAHIRKSELKALYAQINPHFLYNSLETIIWAGEKEDYHKVVQMTSSLAKYFRLSLSKGKEVITINQEIEHVKNYLVIQKIRYSKKIAYEIDVDSDILYQSTLKIILQPIVENSIYHGVKNLDKSGLIKIKGYREENDIVLVVEDNGVGMNEELTKNILIRKVDDSFKTGGVGVKNVHERIQLYYGKNYGLRYESELGIGTKVYIKVPVLE